MLIVEGPTNDDASNTSVSSEGVNGLMSPGVSGRGVGVSGRTHIAVASPFMLGEPGGVCRSELGPDSPMSSPLAERNVSLNTMLDMSNPMLYSSECSDGIIRDGSDDEDDVVPSSEWAYLP